MGYEIGKVLTVESHHGTSFSWRFENKLLLGENYSNIKLTYINCGVNRTTAEA
jgi:hypothetical protein